MKSRLYDFESVRIYVMYPPSYNVWQMRIVSFGDKRISLLEACCNVDVVKGSGCLLVPRFGFEQVYT